MSGFYYILRGIRGNDCQRSCGNLIFASLYGRLKLLKFNFTQPEVLAAPYKPHLVKVWLEVWWETWWQLVKLDWYDQIQTPNSRTNHSLCDNFCIVAQLETGVCNGYYSRR